MRLTIVGTGYVGLVAGAGFADSGNDVVCLDIDADRVARLGRAEMPIFEPGLGEMVERNLRAGRLRFQTDFAQSVPQCDAAFLAVGTPARADGSADLGYLERAADMLADHATGPLIVAIKSTVPVGTADDVEQRMRARARHAVTLVSNPEFLKEGDAVNDFLKPARVVVGTADESARSLMRRLYGPFLRVSDRLIEVDRRSAELIKYASNAMLATRISFMNEVALLCEVIGADIDAVRQGVGADPRIGPKHLFPGPGFGGSCLPKDLAALAHLARQAGAPLDVVEATLTVNQKMRRMVGDRVVLHFGGVRGRTIGIWGLAFKARTDDVRESPACALVDRLLVEGATVQAHDPAALANAKVLYENRVRFFEDPYEAARGVEALCVMTDWPEYRSPDFERLGQGLAARVIFDPRNLYAKERVEPLGFRLFGIGRGRR